MPLSPSALKLEQLKELVQSWLDKQGHDRCHYYPELFRQLARLLGLQASKQPLLPPQHDFERCCFQFADEEFRNQPTTVQEIGQQIRQCMQRQQVLHERIAELCRRHVHNYDYFHHTPFPLQDCERSPIGVCLFCRNRPLAPSGQKPDHCLFCQRSRP